MRATGDSLAEIRRVFVSEYVCGGAWPEPTLDNSFAVEGRAMLLALIDDLLEIPLLSVATTWDARLGEFPDLRRSASESDRLKVSVVSTPDQEVELFRSLARVSDAAFIIAPEFHGILADRCRAAVESGTLLIGCDVSTVKLCSDKLNMADRLTEFDVRTIPTKPFDPELAEPAWPFPLVVKPRYGAGSMLTFLVHDKLGLVRISETIVEGNSGQQFIQQPFQSGLAISCAALISANDHTVDICGPAEQILSDDGLLQYRGTDIPARIDEQDVTACHEFVRNCCARISGLNGYVGFDLILDDDHDLTLVEINPRLTTGYVAFRQSCRHNLARQLLFGSGAGERSQSASVPGKPVSMRVDRL